MNKFKYNEFSEKIFKSNNIKENEINKFIKDLKLTLRLDYSISSKDLKLLDNNEIINLWFKYNSLENIGGATND